MGYPGMCHFHEHTFVRKIWSKISILKKNSEAGNFLLGNLPNFFVKHVTESQNQERKIYISIGKFTKKCKKTLEFWKI